jgi:large-conductance mechanosensitive channel
VNFIILAFIIFMMVKQMNRLRKEAPPAPAPAPSPTPEDVLLLRENPRQPQKMKPRRVGPPPGC